MGRPCTISQETINKIWSMRKEGKTHQEIRQALRVSVTTIRKHLAADAEGEAERYAKNQAAGYRKRTKVGEWYESPIDGERLWIVLDKYGYYRITPERGKARTHLHVHEAKKAFRSLGMPWSSEFVVHHVDLTRANALPTNLSVMRGTGEHRTFHNLFERAMLSFIVERGLLTQFYKQHPDLKLSTLQDLLTGNHEAYRKKGRKDRNRLEGGTSRVGLRRLGRR